VLAQCELIKINCVEYEPISGCCMKVAKIVFSSNEKLIVLKFILAYLLFVKCIDEKAFMHVGWNKNIYFCQLKSLYRQ
jgi:hypothetical protein